jgi:beta-N-acetylhexosaminidase
VSNAASAVLLAAVESDIPTAEELAFFKESTPAGITLFKRNIGQPVQSSLINLIKSLAQVQPVGSPPLMIAIDQEGGRVARLGAPFPNQGPALHLGEGKVDDVTLEYIRQYGNKVGYELRKLAINVNFAPVVDILTNPANQAIGDRVFGTNSNQVTLRAGAFLKGLESTGVAGCLKHFPGQGDAGSDTHLKTAIVDQPWQTLQQRELVPFQSLLHDARMIMIAHCIYPALDPEFEASRSRKIMQHLLREQLGYQGLIVSDDFNMEAIPQGEQLWQQAVVQSIASGADLILVCRHLAKCRLAIEAIEREAARSSAFAERLEDAAKRVLAFRKSLPTPIF